MRPAQLALIILLLAGPSPAAARAWKGINPGATAQAEVVHRFGEPTARTRRGNRLVLAYYGDQALEGTKQAQFHLDASGTVQEITIFLAVPLDADTIEGTYGKPAQKTFVEDTFQKVWVYPSQGVTVYWAKDGTGAEALTFAPSKAGAKPGTEAQKAAGEASKAAAAPPQGE
jgi:hypothetical protein